MLSGNNWRKVYGMPYTNCRGGKFLARNLGMFPFKTVEIQFPFFFPKRGKETLASRNC